MGHVDDHAPTPHLDRRRFLRLSAGALTGASLWMAPGCFGGDDDEPAPGGASGTATAESTAARARRGGTLRMGQGGELNLAAGYPFALVPQNRILTYASHETLVQYLGSLDPKPVLAERYEVSADFRRVIVTLKPGLQFHNGASVTTDDVAFSVETLKDPASAGLPATTQLELANFARSVTDLKVMDARTVEFTFEQPRTNLNDFFAQLHIAQRATYRELASGTVVGTGPFMLKRWDRGRAYRLERFANWHGAGADGRPYLDAIEVSFVPDQTTAVTLFRAGNLDAYLAAGPPNAAPFRTDGKTRLAGKTGMHYLGMNVTNPQLRDRRVRHAIFSAINRNRMMRDAGQDFGTVTTQPWAPTSPAFDPAREAALYDQAAARDLLSQAGFQQGREFVIEYPAGVTVQELQAQLIQSDLKAVGIETRLEGVEGTRYGARYRLREFPDFWLSAHPSGDLTPLTLLQQSFEFRPSGNASSFEDSAYADLVRRLEGLPPRSAEAQDIYREVNRLMVENPFVIPTGIPAVRIDLVQERVAGWPSRPEEYAIAPTGKVDFGAISLR